jgi:hypothetical protein
MEGFNAVWFDFTVFHISASSGSPELAVQLQSSDDLENWSDLGSPVPATEDGYFAGSGSNPITDVSTAYVRITYALVSGTNPLAILGAGINTFAE